MSYCAAVEFYGSKTVFKELSDATANKCLLKPLRKQPVRIYILD
jgi:hypothetical protein